jgi:hypothetical protein
MPADTSRVATPKTRRSAIANGKLLPGVDQRSSWVRRAKELIAEHLADLGGVDATSAAERSLVRRCAVLTTELERLETKFALAGEASAEDLDLYQKLTNTLRRALESLGLQRRMRDVTPPTVDQYLRHVQAQEAAE